MNLIEFEGKFVTITTKKGDKFDGFVTDYIYPDDNEPEGVAGICIDKCPQKPGKWLGFNEDQIATIEVKE